jgi:serine/threonine protein kinase
MHLSRYGHAFEQLGKRYHLHQLLGSGGVADVCLAWDEHQHCQVAVKVLKLDHLTLEMQGETLPDLLSRFLKEGSLVARWRHPHIVQLFDEARLEVLDPAIGSMVPYLVMEYVPGGDLQSRLRPGEPLGLQNTLRIFEQLCSAVHYAHDHEVIHRDIKPSNVLFRQLSDGSEQVVLSDFGLAEATHHTFPGAGTPVYMAPEQRRGQAQKTSDIFALGVLLYRLCTGTFPSTPPVAPSHLHPALPTALDQVILTALAQDPAQRFVSADLFGWLRHAAAKACFSASHSG